MAGKSFLTLHDLIESGKKLRTNINPVKKVELTDFKVNPRSKTLLVRSQAQGMAENRLYPMSMQFTNVEFSETPQKGFLPHKDDKGTLVYFKPVGMDNKVQVRCACFTGDTLIPLANGYSVPIKDLVGKPEFYVYSYDLKTNRRVIGRGHSCRVTGKSQQVVQVTLDNGTKIKCTPDHQFMLKDGTYEQICNISPGQSLKPLYRRLSTEYDNVRMCGYELVIQSDYPNEERLDNVNSYTHHLADDFNLRYGYDSWITVENNTFRHTSVPKSESFVRHHVNEFKRDNSPLNIRRVTNLDHLWLHAIARDTTELSKRMRENNPRHNQEILDRDNPKQKKLKSFLVNFDGVIKVVDNNFYSEYEYKGWSNFTRAIKKFLPDNLKLIYRIKINAPDGRFSEPVIINTNYSLNDIKSCLKDYTQYPGEEVNVGEFSVVHWKSDQHRIQVSERQAPMLDDFSHPFLIKQRKIKDWLQTLELGTHELTDSLVEYFGYSSKFETVRAAKKVLDKITLPFGVVVLADSNSVKLEVSDNHKVVSVELLENLEDVYCFTVDDYENFAIDVDNGKECSSGVFVHNCKDFYFTWQWYDKLNSALFGPPFPKYVRKTATYPERNPPHVTGLCKHLLKLVEILIIQKVISR